jgi:hypothetical protein
VIYLFIYLFHFIIFMLGSWNIWGLNGLKKRDIKAWINKFNLHLIRLLETKVISNKIGIFETTFNPASWCYLSNVTLDINCRILVGWDPLVYNIACLDLSYQWVTYEVYNLHDGCVFIMSYVYGSNAPAGWKDLWEYLRLHAIGYHNRFWLILGDFNVFLTLQISVRVILFSMHIWMILIHEYKMQNWLKFLMQVWNSHGIIVNRI